jgi:beta-galactosidase
MFRLSSPLAVLLLSSAPLFHQAQAQEKELTFDSVQKEYDSINQRVSVRHTPIPSRIPGVQNPQMTLDGNWLFNPRPETGFERKDSLAGLPGWDSVFVPSEWYMPGYRVEKGQWAGYFRDFTIPADWQGKRTVLRFGAVESECRVFINGKEAGTHMGSMVPFEFDITDLLKPGRNTVSLLVRSESEISATSRISHYAKHQVGGILRSVTLFALPQTHISDLFCKTNLSDDLRKATMDIEFDLAGFKEGDKLQASFVLKKKGVEGLPPETGSVAAQELEVTRGGKLTIKGVAIDSPELWHAEHPYLYSAELTLKNPGGDLQTVTRNIGFRKIETRENSLFVNNKPVKLHGVAHHDIHPYYGRAIPDKEILKKDIQMFRDANCNYIRTSHYSPDEYLVDLCDRYGIFLEDEASVCWDRTDNSLRRAELVLYDFKSMLMRDRNHPCILVWSIANESYWSPRYVPCLKLAKETTPDIPVKFSHSEYFGIKRDLDVGTKHYPGWQGLMKYDNYFRPIVFDEALHVNCYNTSENMTDPSLRDLWGDYAKYFVDNMQTSPAIMGLGIWCGIDEMYYPKGEKPIMGGGEWGVIDGFRRPKPEYWHMKMAYSPVRVTSRHFQTIGNQTVVSLENRFNTRNLNTLDVEWTDGDQSGIVSVDVAPMEQGTLIIPHSMKGDELTLRFKDKRGFDVAIEKLPRHFTASYPMPSMKSASVPVITQKDGMLDIQSGNVTFRIPEQTGLPETIAKNGQDIVTGGMKMYAIPMLRENQVVDFIPIDNPNQVTVFSSPSLKNWKKDSMTWQEKDGLASVHVSGKFGDVPVEFIYSINGSGKLRVDYTINLKKLLYDSRQIGIGFDLPRSYDQLAWKRMTTWTAYPDDHIGRPEGKARALAPETLQDYHANWETPRHAWSLDGNEHGSNDFRSTKHNLITGSLSDPQGNTVTIESNGRQHLRAWLDNNHISFLLAQYSNGGTEHYLSYNSNRTRPNLKDESGEFPGWVQIQF